MEPLIIGTAKYEESVHKCSLTNLEPQKSCQYPGTNVEIFWYFLKRANIPYKLRPFYGDIDWGSYRNGSWHGLLGLVYNGTIDTIIGDYTQVAMRAEHFAFSYSLRQERTAFIITSPTEDVFFAFLTVFQVFSPGLWLMVFLTLLGLGSGALILNLGGQLTKRNPAQNSATDSLWLSFRLLLNQNSENMEADDVHWKLLLLCISLFSIFLLPLFQNALLAHLLGPRHSILFNSANELVKLVSEGKRKFITDSLSSGFYTNMLNSGSEFAKKFRQAVNKNPIRIEKSLKKIEQLFSSSSKYVYTEQEYFAQAIAKYYCGLDVVIANDLAPVHRSFVFRKNDPRLPLIDEITRVSMDYTRYVFRKYRKKGLGSNNCDKRHKSLFRPLKLLSLLGTFLVLAVGATAGFLALVIELVAVNKDGH